MEKQDGISATKIVAALHVFGDFMHVHVPQQTIGYKDDKGHCIFLSFYPPL